MVSTVAGNCTDVAATTTYPFALCKFTRIEHIWLDCAFQIFCQDTNLFTDVAAL